MRMLSYGRAFVASLSIFVAAAGPAGVQAAPQDDVRATVQRMVEAMNTGDFTTALSLCSSATIIDQVAPYVFTGADGCTRWIGAVRASIGDLGITAMNVTVDPPMSIDVHDTSAYIVSPMRLAATMKGERVLKNAIGTFVLARGADGWKFTQIVWSRPNLSS